ncbi:MAG: DNA polymerase III subunit gamma/tau [Candidatus Riflebacteria bacterium]|nr:DNA polymerase III subunit gamma/tau [Candidatus Riflebacteria bacterium]
MNAPQRQNLYRKYRPQRFSELAGQEHISRTIQSAVSTDRIAHAYMFSGPRGTGKTSSARLLAKILNCLDLKKDSNGLSDCCGVCNNCKRIEEMNFMDIIEIDAASNNGVEDIRQMREKVKYRPAEGKYKIYIIDEVHMLSGSAFNAFLKTLEEPPPNVIFVLATTDPQKVPATIISRCQCFDFHSVSRATIQTRLAEIVAQERKEGDFPDFQSEALSAIAESAQGGFRDALSLLDQISSSAIAETITLDQVLEMTRRLGHSVLREIGTAVFTKKPAAVIKTVNDLFFRGYEPMTIARDLLEYFRCCMILKIDAQANQVLELPQEHINEITQQIASLSHKYLITVVSRVEKILGALKSSFQAKILLEAELIKLALGDEIYTPEVLEKRIEKLEQQISVLKRLGTNSPATSYARPEPARAATSSSISSAKPASAPARENTYRNPPLETPQNVIQKAHPFADFKKAVMERSSICHALLATAQYKKPENGVFKIILDHSFSKEKLCEEKNLSILIEAAKAVYKDITTVLPMVANEDSTGAAKSAKVVDYEAEIKKMDENTRKRLLAKPEFASAIEVFEPEIIDVAK